MTLAAVVLHHPADYSTLGMEDSEARTDLIWEAKQVQLNAQLAMIALCRLFEALQVRVMLFLRRPCGSIDSLQLLVVLVASPVGSCASQQREGLADSAGIWKVWTAAKISPGDGAIGVYVFVNRELSRPYLCRTFANI